VADQDARGFSQETWNHIEWLVFLANQEFAIKRKHDQNDISSLATLAKIAKKNQNFPHWYFTFSVGMPSQSNCLYLQHRDAFRKQLFVPGV